MIEDAALLGIELPAIEEDDPDFAVDPANWDAVLVFLRCASQWRHGPMGGVLGMDYQGVKSVIELTLPKRKHNAIFAAVQVMEQAALPILNSKSK